MLAMTLPHVGASQAFAPVNLERPEPGHGEILLRHEAIGLNYIDIYHRSGHYPVELPAILGIEGAGIVEAAGPGVSRFQVGDHVAYGGPTGAYAEYRLLPETSAVRLPTGVDFKTAAAVTLKGLTAHALLAAAQLKHGDSCLVWAAAGGVGTILCQWAKAKGARVIGVVSGGEKTDHARAHGCDEVLNHRRDDVAKHVRDLTGGRGVSAVFDGIGKATIPTSLDALATRGILVSYGNASGAPPEINLLSLGRAGSLFVTRVVVFHYLSKLAELDLAAATLFELVGNGTIKVDIGAQFPLRDVAKAHELLEQSRTVGSTILTV